MKKRAYIRYRKSKRWQNKRRTILKRAGYKCRKCGRRAATQVHIEFHIEGLRENGEIVPQPSSSLPVQSEPDGSSALITVSV